MKQSLDLSIQILMVILSKTQILEQMCFQMLIVNRENMDEFFLLLDELQIEFSLSSIQKSSHTSHIQTLILLGQVLVFFYHLNGYYSSTQLYYNPRQKILWQVKRGFSLKILNLLFLVFNFSFYYIFGLSNLQLMDPTQPHPQRFEVYTLLPDKKGFMIKDCNFVFKLDRYGGWKDQNGHYYNANGQPDVQPEDAELSPQQGSINSDEDNYDDYDDYEPDYDNLDDGYEQTHNSWQIKNMERISKNMETLSTYPLGKNLRVFFSNMNYKTPPKSVYEAYSKKVTGIINIIFDLENNLRNGQGHFIMEDAKKAQILVKLQGQKIVQRQVHFEVESLSELIIDPIKQKDLIPFWNSKGGLKQKFSQKKQEIKDQKNKKEQVGKFKAAQVQTKKVEKKQIQKEVKKVEQKNIQLKVQQNKKQNKQINQYQTYQLNFSIFDTKTKFFNWFAQNGGKKDDDIKQIKKEEKDKVTKIFMTIKTSIVQKLNGKDYNGNKVKFTLVSH